MMHSKLLQALSLLNFFTQDDINQYQEISTSALSQAEFYFIYLNKAGFLNPTCLKKAVDYLSASKSFQVNPEQVLQDLTETCQIANSKPFFNSKWFLDNFCAQPYFKVSEIIELIVFVQQTAFDRDFGVERDKIQTKSWIADHLSETTQLFCSLGVIDTLEPSLKHYTGVAIMGGASHRVKKRIEYFKKWSSVADTVWALSGNRELSKGLDEEEVMEKIALYLDKPLRFVEKGSDSAKRVYLDGITETMMVNFLISEICPNANIKNINSNTEINHWRATTAQSAHDIVDVLINTILSQKPSSDSNHTYHFTIIAEQPYTLRMTKQVQRIFDATLKNRTLANIKIKVEGIGPGIEPSSQNAQMLSLVHSEMGALMAERYNDALLYSPSNFQYRDKEILMFSTRDKFHDKLIQNNGSKVVSRGYYILDFKYKNDSIYPLEMGDALYKSDFKGYDAIVDNSMINKIFTNMQFFTDNLQLTVSAPRNRRDAEILMESLEYANSKIPVIKNNTYNPTENSTDPIFVNPYSLAVSQDLEKSMELQQQLHWQKKSNIVLNAHDTIAMCSQDKVVFSLLLKSNPHQKQPKMKLIEIQYYEDKDLESFISPEGYYVFKATNQHCSTGMFIEQGKNIYKKLDAIKNKNKLQFLNDSTDPAMEEVFNFWIGNTNNGFIIVQNYIESDVLTIQDKDYDPTGRAVFYIESTASNTVRTTLIDGYWEVPVATKNKVLDLVNATPGEQQASTTIIFSNIEKKQLQHQANLIFSSFSTIANPYQLLEKLSSDQYSTERKYFLRNSHMLSFAINEAFINLFNDLFLKNENERADYIHFILNYAKRFCFAKHLNFVNIEVFNWIRNNLHYFPVNYKNQLIFTAEQCLKQYHTPKIVNCSDFSGLVRTLLSKLKLNSIGTQVSIGNFPQGVFSSVSNSNKVGLEGSSLVLQ